MRFKKLITLLFFTFLLVPLFCVNDNTSVAAYASEEETVVRVGWYESTYCFFDSFGRRTGIAYQYQQEIAAHTGWTYEYVDDSWPNLLQKLIDGQVDILSDVSYTQERADLMFFSSLPMGSESYYIYADSTNASINPNDLTTLNGKKIGVNKGSIQEGMLTDWATRHSIEFTPVGLTTIETDNMTMLSNGEIDAYVSLDSLWAVGRVTAIAKIGSSDYYFAVNKERPDILTQLNAALTAIQDEDPFYNERIYNEYVMTTGANAYLSSDQELWINNHGEIKIGYLDDFMPFCGTDGSTKELTGALKNYLTHASTCLKNANIRFKPVAYHTSTELLSAIKQGEIDCAFPTNISASYCENNGFSMTNSAIMQTEMSVIMRASDQTTYDPNKEVLVAVDKNDINRTTFIMEYMPKWKTVLCENVADCFSAVASRRADCTLVCDYRLSTVEKLRKDNKLISIPSGEAMTFTFAVDRKSFELYSILNKIANLPAEEQMEYVLVSYIPSNPMSFFDFLNEYWPITLAIIVVIFTVIIALLIGRLKAQKKIVVAEHEVEKTLRRELEKKEQLEEMTHIAYTDDLTGFKSRHAFTDLEESLDAKIANMKTNDFAFVLFDLNDLKTVNDTYGHEAGDEYIKESCDIIFNHFRNCPIYRIGGDEFVALLEGRNYDERDNILKDFNKEVESRLTKHERGIAAGIACYQQGVDRRARSVLERADTEMYQRKEMMKSKKQ